MAMRAVKDTRRGLKLDFIPPKENTHPEITDAIGGPPSHNASIVMHSCESGIQTQNENKNYNWPSGRIYLDSKFIWSIALRRFQRGVNKYGFLDAFFAIWVFSSL